MTLGSLFSGSGGFELAGALAGIEPVWNAEIEPFPAKVTEERFPHVVNYGDVTKINGGELPPVDIITFGSPCQDLSTAGRQAGLHEGGRSILFFEAIRIITEMLEATDGKYPRYTLFENVPGMLTSHKGDDFRDVLQAFVDIKDPMYDVPKPDKLGGGPDASWETVTALPGVPMTLNFGVSPSVARESTFLAVYQDNAPEKYYLSVKASAGILRRAEERGKELPPILKDALERIVRRG